MNRPWKIWLAFALSTGLALAAMAWLTGEAVRADLDRTAASNQAELEQQVSLVLWRMDTKLAPLIAEEVARPPSFYRGNSSESPFGLNDRDLTEEFSRLSAELPRNVILNFNYDSVLGCQSPQVPDEKLEQVALDNGFLPEKLKLRKELLQQFATQVSVSKILEQLPTPAREADEVQSQVALGENPFAGNSVILQRAAPSAQQSKGFDLQQRSLRYNESAQQEFRKQRGGKIADLPNQQAEAPVPVSEGLSHPIWVGENLLLVRRVSRGDETVVQGTWLDWPGIREELLVEAKDLLPEANLTPVGNVLQADPTRMLAGLPVMIHPGIELLSLQVSDTMRWSLWIGWIAIVLAAASSAVLLAGVVALSERRAAFVSSVTHELRTPLTTFRMYADMLARGMVPDAERRQQYHETLRTEAERLTHLVENVLSYARLERGRKVQRHETVTVNQLVERLQDRLTERAEQADMQLLVTIQQETGEKSLTTDVGVVEQILFNLVDNSAKYAARADDRRIHWGARTAAGEVELTIGDHGPGFTKPSRARRSQAFSKTAEEAAVTAPGVGLGLALCRQLARQLGGRLEIADSQDGVKAILHLPLGATKS
jgi:signal transduction histidine kinase